MKSFEEHFVVAYVKPFYHQPQRHYHCFGHIQKMMDMAKERSITLSPAQMLAIWFHDAVYVPSSKTNEADSVVLMHSLINQQVNIYQDSRNLEFYELLQSFQEVLPLASSIILDTKTHVPSSDESAIVLDLDMSIMGSSAQEYDTYVELVRGEFAEFSDRDFYAGRLAFLKNVLQQEKIFYTQKMHDEFDSQARDNIAHEIIRIESKVN